MAKLIAQFIGAAALVTVFYLNLTNSTAVIL